MKSRSRWTNVLLAGLLAAVAMVILAAGQGDTLQGAQPPGSGPGSGPGTGSEVRFLSDQVLVKIRGNARGRVQPGNPLSTGLPSLDAINREHGVVAFERVAEIEPGSQRDADIFAWYRVRLAGGAGRTLSIVPSPPPPAESGGSDIQESRLFALHDALLQDPNVEAVELDYEMTTQFTPNDPYYSGAYSTAKFGNISQWAPQYVNAPAAWETTLGSPTVKIAIVDTGVDASHPDLQGKVVGEHSFVARRSTGDGFGHGTHVAGIAAANTDNNVGVAGLCPRCSILSVQVLNAQGVGYTSDVAAGIRYAADKGARVINLSLGGPMATQVARDALDYAFAKNALPIVAMGNSNTTLPGDLAHWYTALSVAAIDKNGSRASFSNYGDKTDVAAPGVAVLSTMPTYTTTLNTQHGYKVNYDALSGTSMAAPVVAGIAGLVLSVSPSLTAGQVKGIIMASARDGASFSPETGFGVVDAAKAVALAVDSDRKAPTATVVSPSAGTPVSKVFSLQFDAGDDTGVHHIDLVRDGTRFGPPLTGGVTSAPVTNKGGKGPKRASSSTTSSEPWSAEVASTLFWNGPQMLEATVFDVAGNSSSVNAGFTVENTYVTRTASSRLCWPAVKGCDYYFWAPGFSLQSPAVVHVQSTRVINSLTGGNKSTVLLSGAQIGMQEGSTFYIESRIVAGNTVDFYPNRNFCACSYNTFGTYIAGWLGAATDVRADVFDTVTITYPQ